MQVYSYDEAFQASLEYFNGNELSAKVFVDKYALRNLNEEILERTPRDMHVRIATELARIEKNKFKKPLSFEVIFSYLDKFKKIIPQGSILYGLGNPYQYVTLSNCYVLESPLDSYGGIHLTDEQITQISKRRGGCGIDISHIRPNGMITKNSSRTSTGIVPFMERFSNSIREVGQNGRRGAQMQTISVHHPQVLDFARIKLDPLKVTGANISIRLTDEFLKAVEKNEDYEQRFPVDSKNPRFSRKVKAKEVWNEIIKCAHARAEPGLLFWDNILKESPADCYIDYGFETISTNPCCISKECNVYVDTKDGPKEIKQITNDDLIWLNDIRKWAKTSGYFSAGKAIVYRVAYNDGWNYEEIDITQNHKLAKVYKDSFELVELIELAVGDKLKDKFGGEVTITDIKSIGIKEVGCIEVDKYHYFSANRIISGNSELPLSILDSCRLLVLNLFAYLINPFQDNAHFDFHQFNYDAQIAQRLMDDIVDAELECIDRILEKLNIDPENAYVKEREIRLWNKIRDACFNGRRTGLGITGLGDTLAALGIKYGSDKSIELTERIYRELKLGSYRSSVDIAKELGPFPIWKWHLESENPFLLRIKEEDKHLYEDMAKYGRRNIANLTTAPTGTISIEAAILNEHNISSGIEPVFMLNYKRRKKINPTDKNARTDFVDKSGDSWQEFDVYHPALKEWMRITGETDIKKSPWYGCCAEDLDWKQRVKLQAAAQRHVDHAISSTINLPENVPQEKVAEIYETAWKSGCKGITVYRKNCRSGVLVEKDVVVINDRPKELPCEVHHTVVKGTPYFVLVGLLNEKPYEVFAGRNGFLAKKHKTGTIIKKKGYFKAVFDEDAELSPITSTSNEYEEAITRLTSTALRSNTNLEFIVSQLEKVQGDMHSFAKGIARALKKYIPEGTVSDEHCRECGGQLIRTEGCLKCLGCGTSKCQ